MDIKIKLAVMFAVFLFLVPSVVSVGLSPPQLRAENVTIGVYRQVAQISVVNTDDEPMYVALGISSVGENRLNKLRVICMNCSRNVGIQRGDLKNGLCPFCSAGEEQQIRYDLPPRDVLENISLKCEGYHLEQVGQRKFVTVDKVPSNTMIAIDIYVELPEKKEYYNQHWEIRIQATTIGDKGGNFIVTGVESKFLVDTISMETKEESGTPYTFIAVGAIIVGIVIVAFILYMYKEKKTDAEAKPKKGRKIL